MKKMQKGILKFIITLAIIVSCMPVSLSQTSSHRLTVADSLFAAKKYTQSFEHYQAILQNQEYTPAMLLRMAFIQEGLDNVGQALYYLNLYYLASNDAGALQKMDELASKYNLRGYKHTYADRFFAWYHEHHLSIAMTFAACCFFLLALSVYLKRKTERRPVATVVTLAFFLAALFIHLNLGEKLSVGIITQPNTYVMNGPSPGANVVEIVSAGHRIEVIGKKDVWLKVRWEGTTSAYIRDNNVQPVTLQVNSEL